MDIGSAIRLLCEVHTKDNDDSGFVVNVGAHPQRHLHSDWHVDNYLRAWNTLRRAIEMPTEP